MAARSWFKRPTRDFGLLRRAAHYSEVVATGVELHLPEPYSPDLNQINMILAISAKPRNTINGPMPRYRLHPYDLQTADATKLLRRNVPNSTPVPYRSDLTITCSPRP